MQAQRADENHVFNLASLVANRLLGFYTDLACNALILSAALFSVCRRGDSDTNAGLTGLALSYVIGVCGVRSALLFLFIFIN